MPRKRGRNNAYVYTPNRDAKSRSNQNRFKYSSDRGDNRPNINSNQNYSTSNQKQKTNETCNNRFYYAPKEQPSPIVALSIAAPPAAKPSTVVAEFIPTRRSICNNVCSDVKSSVVQPPAQNVSVSSQVVNNSMTNVNDSNTIDKFHYINKNCSNNGSNNYRKNRYSDSQNSNKPKNSNRNSKRGGNHPHFKPLRYNRTVAPPNCNPNAKMPPEQPSVIITSQQVFDYAHFLMQRNDYTTLFDLILELNNKRYNYTKVRGSIHVYSKNICKGTRFDLENFRYIIFYFKNIIRF